MTVAGEATLGEPTPEIRLPDVHEADPVPTLREAIANRRWLSCSDPFPHVIVENVFTEAVYREFEAAFQDVLSRGFGSPEDADRLARNLPGYDAYALNLYPGFEGPFRFFLSRAWHDMMADLLRIDATGDVVGALHHHSIDSAPGVPHNDLNPGWFVGETSDESVNVLDRSLNNYLNGDTYRPGLRARETVRAGVMIFYVANPPWHVGAGGETGLYRAVTDPVDRPVKAVPPINNSLLLFKCTPHSYHCFVGNRFYARNSVIMWIHRTRREVVARWGEDAIVGW
jgi:hypothetical protein